LFLCCDQQCVDTCCICFYLKWFGIVACSHFCAAGRHPWRPDVREKPKSRAGLFSSKTQHRFGGLNLAVQWAQAAGATVCVTAAGSPETGFACSIRRTDGARSSAPTGWVGVHPARSLPGRTRRLAWPLLHRGELAVRGVLCAACESVDCTYYHCCTLRTPSFLFVLFKNLKFIIYFVTIYFIIK
jgi:hypothetical protein